jgi:hypothetical protein
MKVVSYLAGVPSPLKSPHKTEVLRRFAEGVQRTGDTGIAHSGNNLIQCDVGVIQGWVHAASPKSEHLMLRRNVSNNLQNRHTIIVDSNLFNYNVGKLHPAHYSRYSMDGVFPTTGNYFDDTVDSGRWQQICRDLNLSLKDWRTTGDYILLACQRDGGWSMAGYNVIDWVRSTIVEIRKYSDRPIVVRGHPGDRHAKTYLAQKNASWTISTNEKIVQDFKNAWATITYNSSPGVASAIEGIPVFVTDPTPTMSQAYSVANTDLSQIENPKIFERQQWIERLSMSHWKFDELSDGTAWTHMRTVKSNET